MVIQTFPTGNFLQGTKHMYLSQNTYLYRPAPHTVEQKFPGKSSPSE